MHQVGLGPGAGFSVNVGWPMGGMTGMLSDDDVCLNAERMRVSCRRHAMRSSPGSSKAALQGIACDCVD